MKPWLKNRNNESTYANIFSKLPLNDKFWHYFRMNATSTYWSYIDFSTLITYTSYITNTYDYETCIQKQRPEVFCKKGILKNSRNFIGKHTCRSLSFTKLKTFRPSTLLKRGILQRCFPVKFPKFLRTPILKNICKRLFLCIDYFII